MSKMRACFRSNAIVAFEWAMAVLFSLPRFRLLGYFKAGLLKLTGAKVGSRVTFYPGVWIMPGKGLTLGDDVDLAQGVLITSLGGVNIGDRCLIGYRTQILSSNHRIPPGHERIFDAGHVNAPVCIGTDVWIGGGSMILPGVTIGEGAVVAGGAVVTKDIPSFEIWGGVPAKKIRSRGAESVLGPGDIDR